MKQEHEMTPGVLVSGEVLSAGDARARVAVLEAEVAELRKRVSVPEGHVVVPSVVVEFLKGAGALEGLWFGQSGIDRGAFWWRKYLFAAAPAPVERVEQEAKVFWVLFDNTGDVKYIKKDVYSGTLAFFDNEADASLAKQITPDTDYMRVEYYTAPQPAPTAAQDVAGPTMLELLEKIDAVRMGAEESAHHVHGAAYWNNAVVACLDAVRKAHQSGGVK